MEGIEKKNPNSSWSAIGAGAMMRDIGKALDGWQRFFASLRKLLEP